MEFREDPPRNEAHHPEVIAAEMLVQLAQAGDREAFGTLTQRYWFHVFGTVLGRVRDYQVAEDVTQDVFVQAQMKLADLREPRAFGGWLRTMGARMAINHLVRGDGKHFQEPETSYDHADPLSMTPDESLMDDEEGKDVRDALGRLGDRDRRILELRYVYGLTLLEIIDALEKDEGNVPMGTVKRRLHVARGRFESALRFVRQLHEPEAA